MLVKTWYLLMHKGEKDSSFHITESYVSVFFNSHGTKVAYWSHKANHPSSTS